MKSRFFSCSPAADVDLAALLRLAAAVESNFSFFQRRQTIFYGLVN
jgi:hypothetical protein